MGRKGKEIAEYPQAWDDDIVDITKLSLLELEDHACASGLIAEKASRRGVYRDRQLYAVAHKEVQAASEEFRRRTGRTFPWSELPLFDGTIWFLHERDHKQAHRMNALYNNRYPSKENTGFLRPKSLAGVLKKMTDAELNDFCLEIMTKARVTNNQQVIARAHQITNKIQVESGNRQIAKLKLSASESTPRQPS